MKKYLILAIDLVTAIATASALAKIYWYTRPEKQMMALGLMMLMILVERSIHDDSI